MPLSSQSLSTKRSWTKHSSWSETSRSLDSTTRWWSCSPPCWERKRLTLTPSPENFWGERSCWMCSPPVLQGGLPKDADHPWLHAAQRGFLQEMPDHWCGHYQLEVSTILGFCPRFGSGHKFSVVLVCSNHSMLCLFLRENPIGNGRSKELWRSWGSQYLKQISGID